jgi:hypothetical protein
MNKTFILTLAFIFLTTLCQALNFDKNWWYDFDGKLGGTAIQLSIYIPDSGNVLKGNYCYNKYETKIQLVGQLNDDKIELTEFLNGKPNGHFSGKVFTDNLDRFEGTWTDNSGTKQIEFKMTLQSACYAHSSSHRYSDFSGTDDDVESFMKHVKLSILNGDKEWIADHVNYPISTTLNGQKKITIQNRQQLIDNFEQIFYQKFKEKLKTYCVCNMFNNYQGTMLGNGVIWITDKSNSTDEKFDYQITAINNS